MELRNLPLGNFFMSLPHEDAGMSSTELAAFNAVVVFVFAPAACCAVHELNVKLPTGKGGLRDDQRQEVGRDAALVPPERGRCRGIWPLGTECLRPSAFHYARDDAIRHANRKIADGVECRTELQGP